MSEQLYDVVGVQIGGKSTVRMMAEGKTIPNAEAIVKMAVMRRGVNDEFFCEVPAGLYKEGERWEGREKQNRPPVSDDIEVIRFTGEQPDGTEPEMAETFDECNQEERNGAL
jgi:hypothetical protein